MYAIGDNEYPGFGTLVDKASTVAQTIGKMIASGGHRDSDGTDLNLALLNALGDLQAAITFACLPMSDVARAYMGNMERRELDRLRRMHDTERARMRRQYEQQITLQAPASAGCPECGRSDAPVIVDDKTRVPQR